VISRLVRQHRTTRPRDVPYGEEPLAVRWRKRQYRCLEEACPRRCVPPLAQPSAAAHVTKPVWVPEDFLLTGMQIG
jgi:hypothetical protein